MAYKSTEFDYQHGKGGCWITDSGDVIHVPYLCGHHEVLSEIPEAKTWYSGGYSAAFYRGWIRVTLCEHNSAGINLTTDASLQALRKARDILPDLLEVRQDSYLEIDDIASDYIKGKVQILKTLMKFALAKLRNQPITL